jgi:hypothetical protein
MQLQSLVAGLTKAEGVITSAALSGVVARRSSQLPKENADESTHLTRSAGRERAFLTLEHIQQRDK